MLLSEIDEYMVRDITSHIENIKSRVDDKKSAVVLGGGYYLVSKIEHFNEESFSADVYVLKEYSSFE